MKKTDRRDSGIIIPLLVILVPVILALVALALGITFVASSRTKFKNLANVAALSVIATYIENEGGDPEQLRRTKAVDRGNFILGQNELRGLSAPLGDLAYVPFAGSGGLGGSVRFGKWYENEIDFTPPSECNGKFPCLLIEPTDEANAVVVDLKTQPDNKLKSFFTKILGKEYFDLEAQAIATVVKSCNVFLLDLSLSTANETHQKSTLPCSLGSSNTGPGGGDCPTSIADGDPWFINDQGPNPYWKIFDPAEIITDPATGVDHYFSMAAFPAFYTNKVFATGFPPDCTQSSVPPSTEALVYCNMEYSRRHFLQRARQILGAPLPQYVLDMANRLPYRADYFPQLADFGQIDMAAVDRDNPPKPWEHFMFAANAAGRLVGSLPVNSYVGFYGFMGDAISTFPPMAGNPPELPLTNQVGAFAQLTNVNFGGRVTGNYNSSNGFGQLIGGSVSYPNFIDAGFFPRSYPTIAQSVLYGSTNYVKAISDGINALANCSEGSQRSIVILGDGISTCKMDGGGNIQCNDTYSIYQDAEAMLLDRSPSGILGKLIRTNTTLSAVLAGRDIAPHFLDRISPAGNYYSISNAMAMQYGGRRQVGQNCNPTDSIVDCQSYFNTSLDPLNPNWVECGSTPECTNEQDAFEAVVNGDNRFTFGGALGTFAELAQETGGFLMPVMDYTQAELGALATDYYDDDGDHSQCMEFITNPSATEGKTPCILKPSARGADGSRQFKPEKLLDARGQMVDAMLSMFQNPYKLENPRIFVAPTPTPPPPWP